MNRLSTFSTLYSNISDTECVSHLHECWWTVKTPGTMMESVGPHGLSLTKSDQLHFINILESTKPNHLWSWCFTGVSRSGRHIQNIFLPDISVVQQLPSISPCSRLLPVTSHPALIPHIILVVI